MPQIPAPPQEIESQLKASKTVTLDANGLGVLQFDPDNANQRWEIESVVISTDQSATAVVVPVVTLADRAATLATMGLGNQQGASWNGNQITFRGKWDVGNCDYVSVMFSPPRGTSGATLSGVHATAVVLGRKFTRRA